MIVSRENDLDVTENNCEEEIVESIPKIDINDPNLLDTITRRYEGKIVGEKQNIKTAICSIISRNLPKKFRFSLIILNQSGTGKSHLINSILEPLRDSGDVVDFTDFSEAYFKRTFSDVNGKIIKIEQLERRDGKGLISIEKLKHILTEGVIKIGNAERDEDGKHSPKAFEVRGIPVVITTATSEKIDPETESRFLIIELDETETQTESILKHTLDAYSKLGGSEQWSSDMKALSEIFLHLKQSAHFITDIKIPFADKLLSKLPKTITIRRDLPKILGITCCLAFIHYKNRDKLLQKEPEHMPTSIFADTEEIHKAILIADTSDLINAIEIAGNPIKQTVNKTTLKSMEFLARLKKIYSEKMNSGHGVTINDLKQELQWPETTIRDCIKGLIENGYLSKEDTFKEHEYHPLNKDLVKLLNLLLFLLLLAQDIHN